MAVVSLRPKDPSLASLLMFTGGYTAIFSIILGSFQLFFGVLFFLAGLLAFGLGAFIKLIRRN